MNSPTSNKKCLESPERALSTFGKLESFLLEGHLTDVVLIAGKHQIPAHRLVLSAASEYFAALFRNDSGESSQKDIELDSVDGDILRALIHYCYTGKIEFSQETVQAVLDTANFLQLTEVAEACREFINELQSS